ncbi:MAG TPA: methyltransferase domain-containing protein [Xanthomonadales bacterium]|nr:methyltransferase domain-containing protein [Xanthomonadales bacterium]
MDNLIDSDRIGVAGPVTSGAASSCCAEFYQLDWVRHLAQDCFHPGGEALTRRTLKAMQLSAGQKIVDVGCATGSSVRLMKKEFGLVAFGVDPGLDNLLSTSAAATEGPGSPLTSHFIQAEAARLPFRSNALDGVLAECTFSLFPDQIAALTEFRRVLKPGGALGLTDMSLSCELPADLEQQLAPWTCLMNARSEAGYRKLFDQAGFVLHACEDESEGLLSMIGQLKRKLLLLAAGSITGQFELPGIEVDEIHYWLDQFRDRVLTRGIRYLHFNLSPG